MVRPLLVLAVLGPLLPAGGSSLPPAGHFALEGFASLGGGTTGGGAADPLVIDARTPDPARALQSHLAGDHPAVVDLRADVDLAALANGDRPPLLAPGLVAVGVVRVGSNKTLVSTVGATLRHGTLLLDGSRNVIVRNLRFRGLWEWDDATRGAYDRQGWDYLALRGARNVWIDHCDFGRVYDGPLDITAGSDRVTVSWTRFTGATDGEVERQAERLEALMTSDPGDARIAHYRALRRTLGSAEIAARERPQTKGTLVGGSDRAAATDRGRLNVTFHHVAFLGVRQRTPRVRFGNAHVYNVLVDHAGLPPGTSSGVASTMGAAVLVENSLFVDVRRPLSVASGGRLTQRGSLWRVEGAARAFERDAADPGDASALLWNPPAEFPWPDRRAVPYPYALDEASALPGLLDAIGVIVAGSRDDERRLRERLLPQR